MVSCHPVITSYFHSSNSASWLSTAFLLTSTSFQPLFGRLSDSLGRKAPYVFTMVVFVGATLWCALAQSMLSFIMARALCGLGAGGIMSMGSIITSDLVPIEIRGAYQSYINIVFGIGSALGAATGGAIADHLGWR
jgi:MFS family permease